MIVSIIILFMAVVALGVYCRYLQVELCEAKHKAAKAMVDASAARQVADSAHAKAVTIASTVNIMDDSVHSNQRNIIQLKEWAVKLTEYLRKAMPAKLKECPLCDDQCEENHA